MEYYSEPDDHKFKVVLVLANYSTKKDIGYSTSISKSNLAAKEDFIALKCEVVKLEINKLANIPTSLNFFFKKLDNLDISKLKAVIIVLKKLSYILDIDVAKNTK